MINNGSPIMAPCVYTLASRSRNLYTGVTSNLQHRIIQHRQGRIPGFTAAYKIFRLVHFEQFADIRDAIAREKEIKGWRREKKIRLIERANPTWTDLAEHLPTKPQSTQQHQKPKKQIPHTGKDFVASYYRRPHFNPAHRHPPPNSARSLHNT